MHNEIRDFLSPVNAGAAPRILSFVISEEVGGKNKMCRQCGSCCEGERA